MELAAPTQRSLRESVPDLVRAVLTVAAGAPAVRVLSERAGAHRLGDAEAPLVRAWIARRVVQAQEAGEVAAVHPTLVAELGFALLQAAMAWTAPHTTPADAHAQLTPPPSVEPPLVDALRALLPPQRGVVRDDEGLLHSPVTADSRLRRPTPVPTAVRRLGRLGGSGDEALGSSGDQLWSVGMAPCSSRSRRPLRASIAVSRLLTT